MFPCNMMLRLARCQLCTDCAKFQKSLSIFVHSAGNCDVQDKRTTLGGQITLWEPGKYIQA